MDPKPIAADTSSTSSPPKSTTESPPPIPPAVSLERLLDGSKPETFATRVKTIAILLWQRTRSANQIIAKQVARAKIKVITLPRLYQALGAGVYEDGKFRDEFRSSFGAIDDVLVEVATIQARSEARRQARQAAREVPQVAPARPVQPPVTLSSMQYTDPAGSIKTWPGKRPLTDGDRWLLAYPGTFGFVLRNPFKCILGGLFCLMLLNAGWRMLTMTPADWAAEKQRDTEAEQRRADETQRKWVDREARELKKQDEQNQRDLYDAIQIYKRKQQLDNE